MKPLRIGFLSPLAVLATTAALGAVIAVVWFRGAGAFSPGDLSRSSGDTRGGVSSHAEITACGRCHPPPWTTEVVSDRCAACHLEVIVEVDSGEVLHGRLPDATRCLGCHTEHRGADARPIAAGRTPHESFGFSLRGHDRRADGQPFGCADCHPETIRSFAIGTCTECHDRESSGFAAEHVRSWGDECLGCHDGVDRYGHDRFDHGRSRFALTGRHALIGCSECHEGTRSQATFSQAPAACVGCHPEPGEHLGQFGTECSDCHSTDGWQGARFDHRFPLDHGRRGESACRTCHPRAPNYDTYSCYGCHEHSLQSIRHEHLEEGIRDFQDCVRCHPSGREHERGEGGHRDRDDDDEDDDD